MNALLHFFNTVEPIQGCFADIVSCHVKCYLRISNGLLIRCDSDRCMLEQ